MNYGKHETQKKIKSIHSKGRKYSSKILLTVFKTCFLFVIFLGVMGFSVGIGVFSGIIGGTPDIETLSIAPEGYATTIYDSAGNITNTLVQAGSNRQEATFDELPQVLIDAFIAIEDARFMSHQGIDLRSILRAAVGILTDDFKGGGSTLTQQLIKNNVFEGGMETSFGAKMERKLQEQYLAVQLEKTMSKEEIITNYLNTINLGSNTLGVKVAAKRYFNKDVSELTLSESTVIAGITQNPAHLNPITGREKNEEKRKVILQYMLDQELITKEQQAEALVDDVYERIQNVDIAAKETTTPYSYFTDELIEQAKDALKEKFGYSETQAYNMIYSSGLDIHTTQDPTLQAIVDEEVNNPANYTAARYSMDYRLSVKHVDGTSKNYSGESIRSYHKNVLHSSSYDGLYNNPDAIQKDIDEYKAYLIQEGDEVLGEVLHIILQPQVSFVLMDQKTGQVKAISGGRGEKTGNLTLNRATNTKRQPGSTFKVITAFAPAMDTKGATLGTVYYDSVYTIGKKTFVNWYKQGYQGYSSIRDGIVYSMNIVAVRCLMETLTPQLGVEYAENLGITSLTSTDLNAATALGGLTVGVSNLELTAAFAAIANGGVYTKPIFFTKILDHNGKVLIDNQPQTHRALKDSTAFLLTDALAASMESNRKFASNINSTSTRSAIPNMSNAGKSGTTTNDVDVWFEGYTPYYTAGVWAGCDSNQRLTGKNGGTSFHKDIWRKIMTRVHEGLPDPGFATPDSIETSEICRKSGKLAISGICDRDPRGSTIYTEYFAKGTIPIDACDTHTKATVCSSSGMLPRSYCPGRSTRIFMTVPPDSGSTSDSAYTLPGYCYIHGSSSVIIPPNPGGTEPPNPDSSTETAPPATSPIGPGFVQPQPSPAGPEAVGPGA